MDRKTIFDYAVLRHSDNNKWYAVIMNVSKEKLGLAGTEEVDIMDMSFLLTGDKKKKGK